MKRHKIIENKSLPEINWIYLNIIGLSSYYTIWLLSKTFKVALIFCDFFFDRAFIQDFELTKEKKTSHFFDTYNTQTEEI